MNAAKNDHKSVVLMKAFNNACEALNFSDKDKSKLLEVSKSILARNIHKGFPLESKTGELQLQFIMLYRSLFAISDGDSEHWFNTITTR